VDDAFKILWQPTAEIFISHPAAVFRGMAVCTFLRAAFPLDRVAPARRFACFRLPHPDTIT